jgi:hypothetical protein
MLVIIGTLLKCHSNQGSLQFQYNPLSKLHGHFFKETEKINNQKFHALICNYKRPHRAKPIFWFGFSYRVSCMTLNSWFSCFCFLLIFSQAGYTNSILFVNLSTEDSKSPQSTILSERQLIFQCAAVLFNYAVSEDIKHIVLNTFSTYNHIFIL